MNFVSYDEDDDVVIVNNVPFDGPSGGYEFVRDIGNGMRLYRNRQTATTGVLTYYAIFRGTEAISVTAVNGRDWGDFGYGGANVIRTGFAIPDGETNTIPDGTPAVGEYVYTGDYGGVRSFSTRTGVEIVDGEVLLLLDINDLDPDGTTQGSVVANVFNRTSRDEAGGFLNNLPTIDLKRLNFDSANGTFAEGVAETYFDGNVRDTGEYEGLIAGENGTEVGGTLVIEGVANIQNVQYEVVDYTVSETVTETIITIDPISGLPVATDVDRVITTTGTFSALTDDESDAIQSLIDAGRLVGTRNVSPADLPAGAVVTSSTIQEQEFKTEFDAREVGAFVTFQN